MPALSQRPLPQPEPEPRPALRHTQAIAETATRQAAYAAAAAAAAADEPFPAVEAGRAPATDLASLAGLAGSASAATARAATNATDAAPGRHRAATTSATWRGGWAALVVGCLARAVLAVVIGLFVWSLAPAVIGWHPTVGITGSMQPKLHPGDVVVARPISASDVHVGQVLLVSDPDHPGRLRLHRLARIRADGKFILRGDANRADDSTPVAPSALRGVAVLRIPLIGHPLLWIHNRDYLQLALAAGGLLVLLAAARLWQPDAAPTGVLASPRTPRPARRAASVGIAGAVVPLILAAGLLTAPPARGAGKWATGAANSSDSWSAVPYFTCANAALAANPYLYYQLGEASGPSAADSSGNNHTGTYHGGISYGQPGACARDHRSAVTLDGSSGYITTPDAVTNPAVFTLETWFKTTTSRGGKLLGFGSAQTGTSLLGAYDRHLYMTNSGQLVFGVYPNTVKTITSPAGYNDGTWHLADATLSGAGIALYVDGQQVAIDPTVTTAQNYTGYWRIGYDTLFGWPNQPTSSYFAGTLNHVALYAAALTAAQIAAHYNAA
ncbi:MAG TPA: LamG-like jellyroll fold domain-containing protein [Jatrophihabitans sp.]|nr:LamG-like jellyroll fold domain-containing protein [Jatrophihabitans sp.]